MDLALRPLVDRPEELPTCALWLNREWGARHGYSYQETRDWTATGLYLKLGWRTLERFQQNGRDYDLMSKAL